MVIDFNDGKTTIWIDDSKVPQSNINDETMEERNKNCTNLKQKSRQQWKKKYFYK